VLDHTFAIYDVEARFGEGQSGQGALDAEPVRVTFKLTVGDAVVRIATYNDEGAYTALTQMVVCVGWKVLKG